MKLALNYTIFAILATIANIGSQDISIHLYNGAYGILISVIIGTFVGLLVKYILDKKYIFRYQVRGISHDTQLFMMYAIMGILTTVIFWGFEFGFEYIFKNKALRYTGGIIGLAIGYILKYQLDKRFVFNQINA